MTIWAYAIGANKAGCKFRTTSLDGGIQTPLAFNNIGYVGIGTDVPTTTLNVHGKMTINTNNTIYAMENFAGSIWCSFGSIYISSEKILNIQPTKNIKHTTNTL
jgi:hypothetical protein